MHRRTVSLTAPPLQSRSGRFLVVGAIIIFITIAIVFTPKHIARAHISGNHNPGAYPYTKPQALHLDTPVPDQPAAGPGSTPAPAKLIVKVHLPGEDLTWLLKLQPDWRNQVLALDPSFTALHAGAQRVDRGRIAAAYLDYIITHYEHLAATTVFVGPGLESQTQDEQAWRLPHQALVTRIQALQTGYVQDEGFAPLNCPNQQVCEDLVLPFRHPPDEYRTLEVNMASAWTALFNNTRAPEMLGAPGGVEFAVSAAQIRKRSVEEYVRFWEWLATTKMDDDTAGAVMEKLWHVIFGRESVWCPAEEECRCGVFGKC
ncbi:hypothetical protein E8E13_010912 [Curvularia kusanoi]|uniref:Uncharacterized protein n=1 Tax=Curvularia kusanoi TaxID=90978 RepID=A0A9P4TLL3_CURKU|nr:hypothetical protein E8E13_010912 [Curvularia kusanoi]